MKNEFLLILLFPLLAGAQPSTVEFHGSVERLDPELDYLLGREAVVEKLAEGFTWSEGPTWFQGAVLFSDVPENVIFRWSTAEPEATPFLKPSGMLVPGKALSEQGSNGLGVDGEGRLIICQHGDRRLARLEKDGSQTVLAAQFEGKRFNSPNDLAIRKNGEVYFTDPPYGLDQLNESPLKELPFNGVYRLFKNGAVSLLSRTLNFPNGIAFSPDEKRLYVAVSDPKQPRIVVYDVLPDGSLAGERLFFDAASLLQPQRKGSCDGLKLDARGNVFATGPGGVLIISPDGKHLGTILTGQATGNCCWGDDGSTLYITAHMFLCRIRTMTKGAGFPVLP